MALIKCLDCGKEISTEATTCIHCGKPIKESIQTIQLTSKRWKKVKLIAWIGIFVGLLIFSNNINNGGWQNPLTGLGVSIGILSFYVLLAGKFGAWWTNK